MTLHCMTFHFTLPYGLYTYRHTEASTDHAMVCFILCARAFLTARSAQSSSPASILGLGMPQRLQLSREAKLTLPQ